MSVSLWKHQEEGAALIKANKISALFWEPRVGKTFATIAGTDDGDRLVVCPNSVKAVWQKDLELYGETSYIWGTKPKPKTRPRNVICNYESLWRSPLLSYNWDSIIFDESQRLSNIRTKLFDYLYSHLQDLCKARVILLSGTPCPEGFHQTIAQSIIATGQWCGYTDPWEALRTSHVYDEDAYKWKIQPEWIKPARAQLHALGPTMTQKQAGILTRKLYQVIPVSYSSLEEALWIEALLEQPEGTEWALMAQSVASGRSIQGVTTQSSKLDAITDYVNELKRPVVILTRFTASLHYLEAKLKAKGLRTGCIYGEDEGAAARGQVIEQFNNGKLDAIVANVATVKTGINLSHSDTLVFAENSFSGEARIQAEERLTVRGKTAVEIIDFCTTGPEPGLGTIDQLILQAVRAKKDFSAASLRPPKKVTLPLDNLPGQAYLDGLEASSDVLEAQAICTSVSWGDAH